MKEVMGCGMRSSVGFLSRRKITGHSFMKEEFQRRRLAGCTSLYKKDLLGHFGCVNAIEFSNNGGEWLVSGTFGMSSVCMQRNVLLLMNLALTLATFAFVQLMLL